MGCTLRVYSTFLSICPKIVSVVSKEQPRDHQVQDTSKCTCRSFDILRPQLKQIRNERTDNILSA